VQALPFALELAVPLRLQLRKSLDGPGALLPGQALKLLVRLSTERGVLRIQVLLERPCRQSEDSDPSPE